VTFKGFQMQAASRLDLGRKGIYKIQPVPIEDAWSTWVCDQEERCNQESWDDRKIIIAFPKP